MGTAYTPGLTVSGQAVIRKTRLLPIKGQVLVKVGDQVQPDQIVARAELPGIIQTVKLAELLGVESKEVHNYLLVKEGDKVTKGQLLAETKGFFGLFKASVTAPCDGTFESLFKASGHMALREPPIPIEKTAYIMGRVVEVMEGEGAVIETEGAFVQGIFGVGGERHGLLAVPVEGPDTILEPRHISEEHRGKVLVGGAGVLADGIKRAVEVGALGIVCGGVKDSDLIEYLGFDIGVAITGQEKIPLTLIITEGFGMLRMADRTFRLLKSLEGRDAAINGATQIRAGVIRPEIIVPLSEPRGAAEVVEDQTLEIGKPIRIIREPYFGALATVTQLPPELREIESGAHVRVLYAKLNQNGEEVVVPRANVEIIAE
ncbi:MAG: hypothetical protein HRF45_09295 [Fimbriimonadia bacterium]